jgi:hypothetical protein
MASSLAQQLRKVQGDGLRGDDRNKQSLLFTPREAAHVGVDLVHQVACNGLLELEQMDERFAPYSRSLFSEASRSLIRDALDAEEEQRVNASIQSLLQLLSQYLLLRPAHKALEYLIRVYRVNEFNKDELLHAALPYHATRTFGQLVKLCLGRYSAGMARAQPYWSVLNTVRKKGAPMDRPTLVTFCTTVPGAALLTAVAKHVHQASSAGVQSKSHVGFYVALVSEVLRAVGTPSDQFLQQLLPYVAGGLHRTSHPDYVAASLVIAAQISTAAQLTVSVQQGLIEAVCKAAQLAALPSLRLDAVRCTVAIFQHQEPSSFPPRAFMDLASLPGLAEMLLFLQADGAEDKQQTSLASFMKPLLSELADRCFGVEGGDKLPQLSTLLQDIVRSMPVVRYTASLTSQVLSLCAARPETEFDSARELLGELQARHNDLVEQGVADFAQKASASQLGQTEIEDVVRACTAGGRHKLVSGAGTTLLLSLQHPTLAVRLMGIDSLRESMEQADGHDETQHQLIQDCLQTLLPGMDSETAPRILSLPSLLDFVDPEQIMLVLEKIVTDGLEQSRDQGTAFLALRLIVAVAGGTDAADDHELKLRCVRIVMTNLMASASGSEEMRRVAVEAASEMATVAPLFHKIEGANAAADSEAACQPWEFLQNILKCMAKNLVSSVQSAKQKTTSTQNLPDCLSDTTRLAADSLLAAPGRGLTLLVLTTALNSVGEKHEATPRLSKAVIALTAAYSWNKKPAVLPGGGTQIANCWDEASAFPPRAVLTQLLRTTHVDHGLPVEVLCFSVHSVVARMPRVDVEQIPLDLPTAPLQLPERMLGAELDTFARLASSDVVLGTTSDPRLKVDTPISMKTYRRSPRIAPRKRTLDPGILNLDEGASQESQDPDDLLQILASAFILITSTVDTQYGISVLHAMLARHFIGREEKRASKEQSEPILRFLRLFWSTRFHTLTQLHSVQLSVAFLKSAEQTKGGVPSMTARIFVSMQHCKSKEVRLALLSLFDLLHRRGQTGLPNSVNAEITKHSPSLLAGNGYLRTLLTSVLSAGSKASPDVSDSDRLTALKTLTETSVDESEITVCSGNAELLSILRRALSSWTSQRKASSTLLQSLRKFTATYVSSRRAPSFERRCVVQMSFAVLSTATADASANLALIEQVLSSSLVLEPGGSAVDAGWSRLLWDGALSCVTTALVPAENQHMQARVVGILIDACEYADPPCTSAIHQTLARLPLGAQAALGCFTKGKKTKRQAADTDDMDALLGGGSSERRPSKSRKRASQASAVDEVPEFEREMVLLEMLQYKKDLTGNVSVLVPTLFKLLKTEIGREQGGEEYTKQLVLSALQSIAKRGPTKSGAKQDASYDVPVLVDCMRTSTNPSTRNHTLLLLSDLAVLSPSTVLARVVPVFADVGTAAIQVEDTYSMKVIQQILRTVVPPVVADGAGDAIFDLIKLLVQATPSIPKHRRLPLFSCLVSVLTPATYLHGVLLQIFELQEMQGKASFQPGLAGELCLEYGAATQLTSFSHLVDVLSRGFEDVGHDHNVQNEYSKVLTAKFGAAESNHGGLSNTTMKFVHRHVTDKRFLKKLLQERELDSTRAPRETEFESACLQLFKGLLVYLRHVMELRRQMHRPEEDGGRDKDTIRQVRQLETTVFACLSAVQQLLSPSGFVEAITALLAYRDHKVRNRVLQLLKDMLLQPSAVDHSEKILSVLPTLQSLLSRADSGRNASDAAAEDVETPQNKQLVLICIGMMCKTFGAIDSSSFGPVIRTVADTALHENIQLVSSALLCLANLGAQFGPLLLPQLSVLVARLCDGLKVKQQRTSSSQPSRTALLVISALTALKVLVHNVARFLGPHISAIVCQLLQNQLVSDSAASHRDDAEWVVIPAKVHDTLQLIATATPPRQLYAALFGTLDYAASQGSASLIALFRTVNSAVSAAKRSDIAANRQLAIGTTPV